MQFEMRMRLAWKESAVNRKKWLRETGVLLIYSMS